jgi:hypothetical protein
MTHIILFLIFLFVVLPLYLESEKPYPGHAIAPDGKPYEGDDGSLWSDELGERVYED